MRGAMDGDVWNRRYADREFVWTSKPNRFLVAEASALPAGRARRPSAKRKAALAAIVVADRCAARRHNRGGGRCGFRPKRRPGRHTSR
jgi:hypothetical protein